MIRFCLKIWNRRLILSLNTLNTIEAKFNNLNTRVEHCLDKFEDLKEDGEEFVEKYLEFSTKYVEKLEDSKYPSCNFNDCATMVSDAKVYETLFDEMVIKIDEVNSLFFDYLSTASSATSSCDEASTTHCFECEYLNFIHDEIGLRVNVTLVEPKTLPRSEGKAVRVIDKREL